MNTIKLKYVPFYSLVIFVMVCYSCTSRVQEKSFTGSALQKAAGQLAQLTDLAQEKGQNPRNSDPEGNIGWIGKNYDWTEGFFPGTLWLMYEATGDDSWKEHAEYFQGLYVSHKDQKNDHDLGFIFNCSYGQAYRLTGNEAYKQVVIDAANSLMKSYNPNVGLIMSWDVNQQWVKKLGWQYPVIIDNMMNLEMLFEATSFTGDSTYWNAAVSHASRTLENHFRDNYSSYHVLDYDSISGDVRSKQTNQGYGDETAWARGQAWGLYGYAMCYRYTQNTKFLEQADQIATFLKNHPNMPADKVPYWDYDDPAIPNTYRDASAAAIMASALLELDGYSTKQGYGEWATEILKSINENYTNNLNDPCKFIVKHVVGNYPINSELDVSINYADYYYVEALLRLKNKNYK